MLSATNETVTTVAAGHILCPLDINNIRAEDVSCPYSYLPVY
jgi:hypothetical protein